MKIGILTLPFNNNYGGYLQAIALMEVLRRLGHEPTLINRRRNPASLKKKLKVFALGVRGVIISGKKHPFFLDTEKNFYRKGKNMIPLADKYLRPKTAPIYSHEELLKYGNEFDAYIVGSDQVWRPIYVPDIKEFFFDFVKRPNAKIISYAASFGNSSPEYSMEEVSACRKLVKRFSTVTLREESGEHVFNNLGFKCDKVHIVLDPTMLLSKDFYMQMTEAAQKGKGGLYCYVLDCNEKVTQIVDMVSKEKNLKPYYILDRNKWESKSYVMPSIEDWLYGFINADFVITDSFHGTVFSIIFNKPFVVCTNDRRGNERFKSLLSIFNLNNRLVSCLTDAVKIASIGINWKDVNEKLEQKKDFSTRILKESLS